MKYILKVCYKQGIHKNKTGFIKVFDFKISTVFFSQLLLLVLQ